MPPIRLITLCRQLLVGCSSAQRPICGANQTGFQAAIARATCSIAPQPKCKGSACGAFTSCLDACNSLAQACATSTTSTFTVTGIGETEITATLSTGRVLQKIARFFETAGRVSSDYQD